MPKFNTAQPVAQAIAPGDTILLFSAEAVASNQNSIVAAIADSGPMASNNRTFQINWASVPTANVLLYGSNTGPTTSGPQNGQLLYTLNTQSASQTDNSAFAFYWAQVTAYSAGGNLTVSLHVG
jgi:hypothetical protein